MYPSRDVLEELGRLTIAGARLDFGCASLLHHIDPAELPFEMIRSWGGKRLTDEIRKRAGQRLEGELLADVRRAAGSADEVRDLRNDAVHQGWVLRGSDSVRPVAEIEGLADDPEALEEYLSEWAREAKQSPDWLRVPARSVGLEAASTVEHLVEVELRIGGVLARIVHLSFVVASSRETGSPPGYRRPD